ncbi:hypothetical protein F383_10428 [Gossypium arboreum]|uniref:Uncharacterized protein n=1 Tax=Gossypium arboreum TaxID=29729 RepID=A0A0B0NQY6_GOSAR|nr:hypothetical protein F383_10428 [Gossypium arboreum]
MDLFTCDAQSATYLNPEWMAGYICVTHTL